MNAGGVPFQLVSWHGSFLIPLLDLLNELTDNRPEKAITVFPNDRPRRYLTRLLADRAKTQRTPLILPRILTSRGLFHTMAAGFGIESGREAEALDCVALLWNTVCSTGSNRAPLNEALRHMSEADFFPWGIRLAALLEECLSNDLTPSDLQYTEGEVAPFAAALLNALESIYTSYRQALTFHNLTTPGLEASQVCECLRKGKPLPDFLHDRQIILAGFSALNGTEEFLFRRLWEQGAVVCLHGDPALAEASEHVHYSCSILSRWIKKWGTKCTLINAPEPHPQQISFFAGHDLHSQLEAFSKDMETLPGKSETEATLGRAAVALTHSGALLPVLHHLPSRDCNVSLGYPLERTLLTQLIEAILTLRDFHRQDGLSYWRPLLEILRHPYLRMLSANGVSIRSILGGMERRLRSGRPFLDPMELAEETLAASAADTDTSSLVRSIMRITVQAINLVQTPSELADQLTQLCSLLLEAGTDSWTRFPLDAEGLFRLHQHVIPSLKNNLMAHKKLPWALLHNIVRELLQKERIPFEADPLTGIQVLGMLETRLLNFQHIFILDATEDHLPGSPAQDPLMPDSLRGALGLPDTSLRNILTAYTFYRLIAGASSIHLYWQEGITSGRLFDGRKQCSHFVEELIWKEECRRGNLLERGTAPLRTPDSRLIPPPACDTSIPRTSTLHAAMLQLLEHPISPTALDVYLTCPLRFYYEQLCRIGPLEEVNEGDDMAGVGRLLHQTLYEVYKPWIGRELPKSELTAKKLADSFARHLEESDLVVTLPFDSLTMLRIAGPERLRRYLAHQPDSTYIMALETALSAPLIAGEKKFQLRGFADRIDRRGSEFIVLDYKTGTPREGKNTFWTDEGVWQEIQTALSEPAGTVPDTIADPDLDLLPRIASALPSLQLPAYLYMLRTAKGIGSNAAFVALGKKGEELLLLPSGLPETLHREAICERIPNLLRFVLMHMSLCPTFRARPDRHCSWCPSARFCSRSTPSA